MSYNLLKGSCDSVATNGTISDVFGQSSNLPIFNWSLNKQVLAANQNICGSEDATKTWMRRISEDFINCCGANRLDYNFFMNAFGGGSKKQSVALDYYQRYRGYEDENILSASDALSVSGYVGSFQLDRSYHSADGKSDALVVGSSLYNYRTRQMLEITAKNTTTDFTHIITVRNHRAATVDIKNGDKLIKLPAQLVSGYSCKVGQATLSTGFTTKNINKFRMRTSWTMKLEMDKAYQDVLLFAPFVTKSGQVMDTALPVLKIRAMEELQQAKNLFLMFGNTITNPNITVENFTGGEGMMPTFENAANIWDYDVTKGISLTSDFTEIILMEDAKKRTTEWMVKGPLSIFNSLVNGTRSDFKAEVTPLDFGTIKRFGAGDEEIKKLGITSYSYLGRKIAFHEWGEMAVSNGIGNGTIKDTGLMFAMDSLQNNKGDNVPPIQFFGIKGWNEFEDWDNDKRKMENACEAIEGHMIACEAYILNCPDRHYLLQPNYC